MELISEHKFLIEEIFDVGSITVNADDKEVLLKCVRGFLDRLYLSLTNAEILISAKPYNPEILYSLSLTLRTVMVDAILATELCDTARECSKEMNFELLIAKCLTFLSDGINQANAYLQRLQKVQPQADVEKITDSLSQEIKALHKENKIEYSKSRTTQIRQLLDTSQNYNEFLRHFDAFYTVFSKVEHFGLIFFRWNNYPIEKKEESIYKAIRLCMLHYWNILTLLFVSNFEHDFIISKIEKYKAFAAD
jgi:hypothetical protein